MVSQKNSKGTCQTPMATSSDYRIVTFFLSGFSLVFQIERINRWSPEQTLTGRLYSALVLMIFGLLCFVSFSTVRGPAPGGTAIYGLYRYVPL